jgi:hypothetical protein
MNAGESQPMRAKERQNRNLTRLLGQFLELVSVFEEASRTFILVFILIKKAKK